MPNRTRYLFDSDVLITSARLHYAPAYCQIFWDWLSAGHKAGMFFSIDKVKGELLDGKRDPLNSWVSLPEHKNFFQPSLASLGKWKVLSERANDPNAGFTHGARTKFLDQDKADAWLISHAAQSGNFVIVTNEKSEPGSKKAIKLPDAALWLDVKTVKLYDLFRQYAGHNFSVIGI